MKFKELSKDDICCVSLVLIPLYSTIHLYFLEYFQHLWDWGYVSLQPVSLNDIYHQYNTPLTYIFCIIGFLFWIKPTALLTVYLVLYWLTQAPTMNALNWHDQHVAFLTFCSLLYFFYRRDDSNAVPMRRLVLIFLSMFYFGAGLGKIHTAGLSWMDGHTAQFRFLQYYVLFDARLGLLIAENFLLCKIVSIATVVFEISFPICIFVRRLEKIYLWASLLFLTMIYITMKINFFIFLAPVYIIFLPWRRITPLMIKFLPTTLMMRLSLPVNQISHLHSKKV